MLSDKQEWIIFNYDELEGMKEMEAIHVVYANWCPHCVPTTVEKLKKKAKELNIPCVLYDIDDSNASAKADELVKRYGDWSTDYLVPQIFLEYSGESSDTFLLDTLKASS